jgi:aspartyl-tRNA(Asn)/glutamyl-tRNA(Gln) amidotransferase subunit A
MARMREWASLDAAARRRHDDGARARAAAVNASLNAFMQITGTPVARPEAGPLAGLPYAAKDMFRTPERMPSCGLKIPAGFGIDGNSDLITRLVATGADLVGFTGMTELAYEPSGYNATFGRVRNPWNLDVISGGSSSGSAAAVAAGAVVAALGSDTGGSLRIPAHACGVTAWKPTNGLISTRGAMPLAPTLDTIGLLARSADDLLPLVPVMAPAAAPAHPLQRAVFLDDIASDCAPAIGRCLADVVAAIEATGVAIEQRDARPAIKAIDAHALIVMQAESARTHRDLIERNVLASALQRRLAKGLEISDAIMAASVAARPQLARDFDSQVLAGADVAILPVMPIETPAADACDPASERFSPKTLYALSALTRFVNMLGYPAVALPAGFDDNGLPVAVQIVGRPGADLALLDLVRRVQSTTDWHARVPHAVAHLVPEAELRS